MTPGDGIFGLMVRQSPPLDEALGETEFPSYVRTSGLPAVDHAGAPCRRLEKMVLRHDR